MVSIAMIVRPATSRTRFCAPRKRRCAELLSEGRTVYDIRQRSLLANAEIPGSSQAALISTVVPTLDSYSHVLPEYTWLRPLGWTRSCLEKSPTASRDAPVIQRNYLTLRQNRP